jgi:hypothetical protein
MNFVLQMVNTWIRTFNDPENGMQYVPEKRVVKKLWHICG